MSKDAIICKVSVCTAFCRFTEGQPQREASTCSSAAVHCMYLALNVVEDIRAWDGTSPNLYSRREFNDFLGFENVRTHRESHCRRGRMCVYDLPLIPRETHSLTAPCTPSTPPTTTKSGNHLVKWDPSILTSTSIRNNYFQYLHNTNLLLSLTFWGSNCYASSKYAGIAWGNLANKWSKHAFNSWFVFQKSLLSSIKPLSVFIYSAFWLNNLSISLTNRPLCLTNRSISFNIWLLFLSTNSFLVPTVHSMIVERPSSQLISTSTESSLPTTTVSIETVCANSDPNFLQAPTSP